MIWRQEPKVEGPNHFGNRIVFSADGKLFLALGERFKFEPGAGAVEHARHDRPAERRRQSSPTTTRSSAGADADDAIWSYGHRNIEAAAIDPDTGGLWVAEMGPLGGDELNAIEAGANYGWPVVSWGINYNMVSRFQIPQNSPNIADAAACVDPRTLALGHDRLHGRHVRRMAEATSSSAPFRPAGVERVDMESGEIAGTQFIPLNTRIREVEQGPDGAIYLLTNVMGEEQGAIWRMEPMEIQPAEADGDRSGPGAR